ncbi:MULTISPECIES: hypothetical protein [unclassified Streptomyces]
MPGTHTQRTSNSEKGPRLTLAELPETAAAPRVHALFAGVAR